MGRPHKCPFCGESRSVGKGHRRTKSLGIRQIRLCKACHRKFTPKSQTLTEPREPLAENQQTPATQESVTNEAGVPDRVPSEPATEAQVTPYWRIWYARL